MSLQGSSVPDFDVDAFFVPSEEFQPTKQRHETPAPVQKIEEDTQPKKKGRTKQRKRKVTCTNCLESGTACNGNTPCSSCISQNLQCKYPEQDIQKSDVADATPSGGKKRKSSETTQPGGKRKKAKVNRNSQGLGSEGGELDDEFEAKSKPISSQDSFDDEDDDTMDETPMAGVNSSAKSTTKSRRPSRARKVSIKVLRAQEEEEESKEIKKKKSRSKSKTAEATPVAGIKSGEEDPLLEVEKILLQRYNPNIKEMEYLTQHKGFDIHRSIWLTRTALTGNEKFISDFRKYWKDLCNSQVDSSGLPAGQNVWVKLRGHPWWPARVVHAKTIAAKQHDYTVTFYGDNTFGFVNDYTPAQFVVEKFDDPDKHKTSNNLEAVQQVLTLTPDHPEGESEGEERPKEVLKDDKDTSTASS